MNLGDVRQRVLEQVDWQPTQSPDFVALANRLINRAYQTLGREAPYLFWEERFTIYTQPDVSSVAGVLTDRLAVLGTDRLVLHRPTAPVGGSTWDLNGTWDGRMIEVTAPSGLTLRRRIREVWVDIASGTERLSIDEAWPNLTDTDMTYRIFTPEYHLPGHVIELRAANLYIDTNFRLEVVNRVDMEHFQLLDYRGRYVARPETLYRGFPFSIPAPNYTPAVELDNKAVWVAGDPAGLFDYRFTYCWGRLDANARDRYGRLKPRWESPPSPISAKIAATDGNPVIVGTLPDIDYIQHFGPATSARDSRSGYYIRVYARRYTQETGSSPNLETPEVFYLLTEEPADAGFFTHDGSQTLDYTQRCLDNNSYQSVALYPCPDQRYEVDCRVLRAPLPLVNDSDAPLLHADCADALIYGTLRLLHRHNGNDANALDAKAEYDTVLRDMQKKYGMISYYQARQNTARVRRSRSARVSKVGQLTEL